MQAALHTFLHPLPQPTLRVEIHLGLAAEIDGMLLNPIASGPWHNVIFA